MAASVIPFNAVVSSALSSLGYLVSGAITPNVNGLYLPTGTNESKPYYDRAGIATGRIYWNGTDWRVHMSHTFIADTDSWYREGDPITGAYSIDGDAEGTLVVSVF